MIQEFLLGVLVPGLVAGAFLLLMHRLPRWGESTSARIGGLLATNLGFFVGCAALQATPWVPSQAWHWLLFLPLVTLLGGLVELVPRGGAAAAWRVRLVLGGLTGWLIVPNFAELQPLRGFWIALVAALVIALWAVLDHVAQRISSERIAALLLLSAMSGAAVVERSGNLRFTQLVGVLIATLAACALASVSLPAKPFARGAVPAFSVLLPSLLFSAYFNVTTEVPLMSFLFVLAAPLSLGLVLRFLPASATPQFAQRAQLGAVFALLALGIGLAVAFA